MIAFIYDRYFVRLLKENNGLRLQQRGWAERIAERRRPERVVLFLCCLSVFFQYGSTGSAQNRICVVADVIVPTEILAVGIHAAIHVVVAREIAYGLV